MCLWSKTNYNIRKNKNRQALQRPPIIRFRQHNQEIFNVLTKNNYKCMKKNNSSGNNLTEKVPIKHFTPKSLNIYLVDSYFIFYIYYNEDFLSKMSL